MLRVKMIMGLAIMTCALAMSALPASAQIKGSKGNTSGQGKAGESTFEGGNAGFKCASAEGTWQIPTAVGATTEKINVAKWNKCLATKPALLAGLSVTVKECSFTLEQPAKSTTPNGLKAKVETGCVITAPLGCVVTVPKEATNEHLAEWKGKNEGPLKDLVEGNVSGITDTVTAECKNAGVEPTKTAIFKAPKVELLEQNFT